RWTMAEASALGLVGLGGVTTATRALLADDRPGAVEAILDALPAPVDHVLLQADLTVVAPGPLEPELAAEMAAVADVESAGHATVYRITEGSVRRALDTGRTADELHALFKAKSATPVPQGLSYLVDDVARRHGRLRGGVAASFLRCDDEALLAEVLAHPIAAEHDLRLIAPTVVV
ncbi:helicase-associated domain-containing protein, partial [Amycolatopsis sp. SID8362]|uniref:helicase-associated domain-containing protein n=1 Tax=Amycolatopsis sp. SID8362 TaxID=2690346 RepID=UPI00136B99AB